jgi:hypothetical protein
MYAQINDFMSCACMKPCMKMELGVFRVFHVFHGVWVSIWIVERINLADVLILRGNKK